MCSRTSGKDPSIDANLIQLWSLAGQISYFDLNNRRDDPKKEELVSKFRAELVHFLDKKFSLDERNQKRLAQILAFYQHIDWESEKSL